MMTPHKPLVSLPALTRWLLLLGLLSVIGATAFVRKYFGPVSLEQVIYHLAEGGLDHADPRLISRALRYTTGVLVLAGLGGWLLGRWRARWRLALLGLLGAGATASVTATLEAPCRTAGDAVAAHYIDPATQPLSAPARRPDVLMVFVESLEDTHADARYVGRNLVPALAGWRDAEGQALGRLRQVSGASWTMGGLFSALCAVPLKPVGLAGRNGTEFSRSFFSRGQCLTDLLAAQGYEVSFYGGASLKFAGKGKFLASHGVSRAFGREQWASQGLAADANAWGLADGELISAAWADMQRPRRDDRPRLHILLTVDTHPPAGFADRACADTLDDDAMDNDTPAQMRDAFACTDRLVAGLVRRFLAADAGRDKLVWLQGDHLAMENALAPELARAGDDAQRSIFHALAVQRDGRAQRVRTAGREFSHLDVMPTVLAAAGYRWPQAEGRLGMGSALVAGATPQATPTLVERQGLGALNGALACHSPKFAAMW